MATGYSNGIPAVSFEPQLNTATFLQRLRIKCMGVPIVPSPHFSLPGRF